MEFFTTTIYLLIAAFTSTLTIFNILELQARIQRRGNPDPARTLVLVALVFGTTLLWVLALDGIL